MQTLNAMTGGGRVLLGLGSTRRYVAEGLHGRPWGNPVTRMRDFVQIVRNGFEGRSLAHRGTELSIPYPAEANPVEPVKLLLDPTPDIPVYVAAGGQQMITLAGEIADGWLPRHFAPGLLRHAAPFLEEGFRRAGSRLRQGFCCRLWRRGRGPRLHCADGHTVLRPELQHPEPVLRRQRGCDARL